MIITAPIKWQVEAIAVGRPHAQSLAPAEWRGPGSKHAKAQAALASATAAGWLTGSGQVFLRSCAWRGKGLGVSTADMAASVAAAGRVCGRRPNPHALGRLLAALEPTDGSMHRGIALFASRTGEVVRLLPPIALEVGIVDWGGTVDTAQFHAQHAPPPDSRRLHDAFAAVTHGLLASDPAEVGWGASQSALAHQKTLYKPGLEKLLAWVLAAGGHGVCVAHTGTVAGLLFSPHDEWAKLRCQVRRRFRHLRWLGNTRLCGGGIQYAPLTMGKCAGGNESAEAGH